jgi:hypothetical protein
VGRKEAQGLKPYGVLSDNLLYGAVVILGDRQVAETAILIDYQ